MSAVIVLKVSFFYLPLSLKNIMDVHYS